jgi:cell division protein FtsW
MGIGTFVNQSSKPVASPVRGKRTSTGDLVLAAAVIALSLFGLLMVYSSSTNYSLQIYKQANLVFDKQVVFMVAGGLIALLVSRIDYHHWRRFALPLMGLTIILLIGILLVKDVRNGAQRTFANGSFQPSELAKLVTIIYLSVWLSSKREYLHDVQLGLIPLAVILGVIGGLIWKQPDLSAAITILLLGGLLFFLAGGELRQIVLFCLVALIVGWFVVTVSPTGHSRLASYMAGLKDLLQSNSHVMWSMEAVYKGKLLGVGIGNATTKWIGLPFAATDSIFAVIVEELGLVGALGLIGLYGILLWRGLVIASRAPDLLGSLMAAGMTFWISIAAILNMCMIIGLVPVSGEALPFISAGGSNLISTLTAVGILLSISRQSGKKGAVARTTTPGTSATGNSENNERRSYSASVDLRRRNGRRGVSRTSRSASHPR